MSKVMQVLHYMLQVSKICTPFGVSTFKKRTSNACRKFRSGSSNMNDEEYVSELFDRRGSVFCLLRPFSVLFPSLLLMRPEIGYLKEFSTQFPEQIFVLPCPLSSLDSSFAQIVKQDLRMSSCDDPKVDFKSWGERFSSGSSTGPIFLCVTMLTKLLHISFTLMLVHLLL